MSDKLYKRVDVLNLAFLKKERKRRGRKRCIFYTIDFISFVHKTQVFLPSSLGKSATHAHTHVYVHARFKIEI